MFDYDWVGSNEYHSLFEVENLESGIIFIAGGINFEGWIRKWPWSLQNIARAMCMKAYKYQRGHPWQSSDTYYALKSILLTEFTKMENSGFLVETMHVAALTEQYYTHSQECAPFSRIIV